MRPSSQASNKDILNQDILTKYTRQVIIDLFFEDGEFEDNAGKLLFEKWTNFKEDKRGTCRYFSLKTFLEISHSTSPIKLSSLFPGDDHFIRIYIAGHCDVGSDYLYSSGRKIDFDVLANLLANFIEDQNVVISLLGCNAGKGQRKNSSDSFAAKMHHYLADEKQKVIPVIARTSLISVCKQPIIISEQPVIHKSTVKMDINEKAFNELEDKLKRYEKSVMHPFMPEYASAVEKYNSFFIHKQPGSKSIFMMDKDGNQIRVDAYNYLWKKKVFKVLNEAKANTKFKETQSLLEDWLSSFVDKTNEEVSQTMLDELNKPDSVLKKSSFSIFTLFGQPSVENKINILINERKATLASKKTQNIVLVNEKNSPLQQIDEGSSSQITSSITNDSAANSRYELLMTTTENQKELSRVNQSPF